MNSPLDVWCVLIKHKPFHIGRKKSGQVWFTNKKVLEVHIYTPKCTFWQTIYRPSGGAAPWNFYTR